MSKFKYLTVIFFSIIPIFGLTSCSQDKQIVDDAWVAPQLKVIKSSRDQQSSDTTLTISLSIDDYVTFQNAESDSIAYSKIQKKVSCSKPNGQIFEERSNLTIQKKYRILDLLPLNFIPSVEQPPYSHKAQYLCSFEFTLTNEVGSTRRRQLNAQSILFKFSSSSLNIFSNKDFSSQPINANSTFKNEEFSNLIFNTENDLAGDLAVACQDFTHSSAIDLKADSYLNLEQIIHKLNTNKTEFSRDLFEHPIQKCRILFRSNYNSTVSYSSLFTLTSKSYPSSLRLTSQITSSTQDKITLSKVEVARFEIENARSISVTYRILKNLGQVFVHHITPTRATVGHPKSVFVESNSSSAFAWENAEYVYFTVQPKTKIQISAYAHMSQRCFSTEEMLGFDFSFENPERFQLSRSVRPIEPKQEQEFESVETVAPQWSNAYKTNGKNRGNYFLPFEIKNQNHLSDLNYGGHLYWMCW